MKTINNFAIASNLTVNVLTFKSQGFRLKRKGFALLLGKSELYTFEPVNFVYSKDKWMVTSEKFSGPKYFKSMKSAVKYISQPENNTKITFTSFK